jgi:hypothetical protein
VHCLDQRLRSSGSLNHALSAKNLTDMCGPNVITYRHKLQD